MPIYPVSPGGSGGGAPGTSGAGPTLADTTTRRYGTGGSLTAVAATAVGFDPKLTAGDLWINGRKVDANLAKAISSITLDRTILGASTLTITADDPDRTLINSQFAAISALDLLRRALGPAASS